MFNVYDILFIPGIIGNIVKVPMIIRGWGWRGTLIILVTYGDKL